MKPLSCEVSLFCDNKGQSEEFSNPSKKELSHKRSTLAVVRLCCYCLSRTSLLKTQDIFAFLFWPLNVLRLNPLQCMIYNLVQEIQFLGDLT